MGPVFRLSLHQLAGRWRVLLILALAILPVGLAAVISATAGEEEVWEEALINGLLDGLIVGAIMPIVTMALAIAAFGNELEDRTLGYLVLKPIRRSLIVLPKLLASFALGGPLMIASGVVATLLLLDADVQAAVAVGVALFAGVVAYTAIFAWAGLMMSTRALGFALIYVLLWEGVIGTLFGGVRYLSVRGYTLAIMHGIDKSTFEEIGDRVIEVPAAIAGAAAVTVVFYWLAVYRLRRMDVP